jgi:phenol/toluene 2-monooxygenase (NADH) P4/A4
MPVKAIHDHYYVEPLDLKKHYGDQIQIYIGWDQHTLFCAAIAFLASPTQTFQDLIEQQMTSVFCKHPEFEHVNWAEVVFSLDGQGFKPQLNQSLAEQQIGHKSLLRFTTPGLNGYQHAHV